MNLKSRATIAILVTSFFALILLAILFGTDHSEHKWFPETLIALAALVGASWFAGHRLDLMDRDITQRHSESESAHFNAAVKEAVTLMSAPDAPSSVIAGQRWLHSLATAGLAQANLVQSLLCNYLTDPSTKDVSVPDVAVHAKLRQSALNLLFCAPGCQRFSNCRPAPDLSSIHWRNTYFTDLDLRGATFARGNFTDALVIGATFDGCHLQHTQWSGPNAISRTSLRDVQLCGASAFSLTFTDVNFANADLRNNGGQTRFQACIFEDCDFQGSNWTGATFFNCKFVRCNFKDAIWASAILDSPEFEDCPSVTFDLCAQATLKDPAGLPEPVAQERRRRRLPSSTPDSPPN